MLDNHNLKKLKKNYGATQSSNMGHISRFGVVFSACNGFLGFTSGAIPTNLLTISI